MDKASPGSSFRVPPAAIWNGMVAAGAVYTAQQELGEGNGGRIFRPGTDIVFVRNDSGGSLVRGRVLEIGAELITVPTPEALWFEGDVPAAAGKGIAITKFPCISTEIVESQASGIVLCRLNVVSTTHRRADVDAGSTLLQSKDAGRCEILWKDTAATGEQDALVRIGDTGGGARLAIGQLAEHMCTTDANADIDGITDAATGEAIANLTALNTLTLAGRDNDFVVLLYVESLTNWIVLQVQHHLLAVLVDVYTSGTKLRGSFFDIAAMYCGTQREADLEDLTECP